MRSSGPFHPVRALVAAAFTLTALACQETVSPVARVPFTPGGALRTLTGGSSTIIFVVDPNDPSSPSGDARALNTAGQVTGAARGLPGNQSGGDYKPFRWTPGSAPLHIDATRPGTAWGSDINDAGVIAGTTQDGFGGLRGFRAVGNTAVLLDSLPGTLFTDGFTRAVAINNPGQIVGSAAAASINPPYQTPTHAVLWNTSNVIRDLGTLGGSTSAAIDINDLGQVVGTSDLPGNAATGFFLWTAAAGMQNITALLGNATSVLAINNGGQIAGTFTTAGGQSHAFLYTPGAGVRDLGTLGGISSSPTGLNNNGQVVGTSMTAGGARHAFLWSPIEGIEDVTAITGFTDITGLNDKLQTVTGMPWLYGNGPSGPQLLQLTVTNSNQPPVASFTVNCPALQCTFDASLSSDDAGIVRYSWSWGNGRSESRTVPVVKNTYGAAGTYNVTLTVTDAAGLTGSVTKAVQVPTVPPNQLPTVAISAPGQRPYPHYNAGQSVTFTGSATDPEDGTLTGASLVWTSDRDGQIGTGTSFSTSTLSVGGHKITLTATDSKGAPSTAVAYVFIDAAPPTDQYPTARFTATCTGQALPHQCSLDASASTDDNGIVSYQWKWGNGRGETKSTPKTKNTWASAGTYTVELIVRDALGQANSISQDVVVP